MAIDRSELAACTQSSGLFSSLSGESGAVDFLAGCCDREEYGAGAIMFEEGSEGDTLVVLLSGTIRINKRTPAGEDYAVAILRGEDHPCFGELSLFDAEVRSATVVVEEAAVVVTLTRDAFEKFAEAFPRQAIAVYQHLGRVLSGRLRGANDDIVTLFQALLEEVETQSIGAAPPADD